MLNGLNHMIGQAVYGLALAALAMAASYYCGARHDAAAVIWSVVIVGELLRAALLGLETRWAIRKRERNLEVPAT